MLFLTQNKAVNDLVGLDSDLLVDNFISKSIIPEADLEYDTSIFDDISISVQAGLYGLANNAINIGNYFGGDFETYDVATELEELGEAYTSNKDNYDLAGNIITSFIPGTIAFKALQAAKLAKTGNALTRSLGYFDDQSKRVLNETAGVYRNTLNTQKVARQKLAAFGYSTMDEVVTGAVVGASIEASQNLGGILVDESLSFGEKLSRFTQPVLLGAAIGAPFGGLSYYANYRNIVKPAKNIRDGILGDLAYKSVISKDNKFADIQHTSNHILDEIDRIEGYKPKDNEDFSIVEVAKGEFTAQAKTQYTRYISEISSADPLSRNINPTEKSVVDALNEVVKIKIETPEGRKDLRNLMGNVYKADTSAIHESESILRRTESVSARDVAVIPETPSITGNDGIDFKGADFKLIPLNEGVRKKSNTLNTSDKPLSAMAINTDHPEVVNNFEKYTIFNRLIGATDKSVKSLDNEKSIITHINNTDEFLKANGIDVDVDKGVFAKLAKTKEILATEGYQLPNSIGNTKFTEAMNVLFKRMDDNNATEFLLDSTASKWVNIETGNVTAKPIKSLYGLDITKIETPKAVDSNTDLLSIQKLRYQAGKNTKGKNTEYFKKNLDDLDNSPEGELRALVELESFAVKALKNNDRDIKIDKDEVLTFNETYKRIRDKKRKIAIELLKNNDADDVQNALGVNDLGALMSHAEIPNNPSVDFMNGIIKDSSDLNKLTHVRLGVKTKTLSPEEVLLRSADESDRIKQIQQLKAVASQSVGENLDDIFLTAPDLGYVEDISNAGRLVFDSHLKADVGSLNYFSVHVGDQKIALQGRLKNEIKNGYNLDKLNNTMLNSPESAGQITAFTHWYRTRGEKFNMFKEKDGSLTALDSKSSIKYREYRSAQNELAEEVLPVEEWLAQNPTITSQSYTIKDELAAEYVENLQRINKDKIIGPKRMQEEAYHNSLAEESDYLYMPPRDLPFSRYFRVANNDPLNQTKSTLYRVSSTTSRGIAKEIELAQKKFAEDGINAQLISGDDAATQAALKLEHNWDGLDLNLGTAVTSARRGGANPDFALSTIQDIINDTEQWIDRSTNNIATGAVELHYADEISRIHSLTNVEDKFRFTGDDTLTGKEKKRVNPGTFKTIHNQMLGKDAPHSLYNQLNNFVSEGMATVLQPAHSARLYIRNRISKSGELTREDIMEVDRIAKEELKKRGVDNPLGEAVNSYLAKETTLTGRDINEAVAGLQYIASTLLLRLDGIDPIMNIFGMTTKLSSEMKYIQDSVAGSKVARSRVDDVYAQWFGAGNYKSSDAIDLNLLSPYKAVATGMKDMFNGTAKPFLEELEELGIYKGDIKIMMELADDLVVPRGISDKASEARFLGKTRDNVKKATNWLTKPHKASINLTQYTALKFASDLADAAGVDLATKRMLMSGMNHRVNAISSHVSKPRLFQGLVGNAISLYQSYFSHTIGNIVRHASSAGSGPVIRNIAMNASFFGAQSTPAFDLINAQIGATQDKNNADIYTTSYGVLPEPVADALMFGLGSTLLRANLTSRGDITPRYATVLPTNFEDLPIVGAITNTVGAITENVFKTATGGQTMTQGVMNTIIDSKLNRPMSGLVSVLSGRTVDSKSSLVSTHDDLISWGNAVRLAGAKPLDEARVNQAFWNLQSYRTKDQERKASLGKLMRQEFLSNPDIMDNPKWINSKYQSYINAGGNHRNFGRFYTEQVLKSNTTYEQRLQRSIRDLDVAKNYKNVLGID